MVRTHTPEEEEDKGKRGGHIWKWERDVPSLPNTNFASFLLNEFVSHGEKKALVRRERGVIKEIWEGEAGQKIVREGKKLRKIMKREREREREMKG